MARRDDDKVLEQFHFNEASEKWHGTVKVLQDDSGDRPQVDVRIDIGDARYLVLPRNTLDELCEKLVLAKSAVDAHTKRLEAEYVEKRRAQRDSGEQSPRKQKKGGHD